MEYDIIYSDRRSVGITVKDGKITVRAPRHSSKKFIHSIVLKHESWIKAALEKDRARKARNSLSDDEILILKKRLKECITPFLEKYSKDLDVKYSKVSITGAKTRFGSCSSSGNLCFSYRLMLYPNEAIEYVVLHELCHRVYMNHSKDFYDLIKRYMPDYKEREKLLKR
jgi:predicted metal-dependent hydrolase